MMKINSSDSIPFAVGDNRHAPIKLSSLNLMPYIARNDEHRKQEHQLVPKATVRQTKAYKRALSAFTRLRGKR